MSEPGTDLAIPTEEVGVETVEIEFFGEKFTVLKAMNAFSLMRVFDPDEPAELSKYLIKAIARNDQRRFVTLMSQQINLTFDQLFDMLKQIIDVQGDGRPTKPSSESSTG